MPNTARSIVEPSCATSIVLCVCKIKRFFFSKKQTVLWFNMFNCRHSIQLYKNIDKKRKSMYRYGYRSMLHEERRRKVRRFQLVRDTWSRPETSDLISFRVVSKYGFVDYYLLGFYLPVILAPAVHAWYRYAIRTYYFIIKVEKKILTIEKKSNSLFSLTSCSSAQRNEWHPAWPVCNTTIIIIIKHELRFHFIS